MADIQVCARGGRRGCGALLGPQGLALESAPVWGLIPSTLDFLWINSGRERVSALI